MIRLYTSEGTHFPEDNQKRRIWRQMIREVLSARELIYTLLLRELNANYRQSIFGILWIFILPLLNVGVFIILKGAGLFDHNQESNEIPYPLFALLGIVIWQLFSTTVMKTTNCLIQAGSMVVKINFPKIALVFSTALIGMLEYLLKIIPIFILFAFLKNSDLNIISLLAGVTLSLPLYFLAIGVGFVLAILAGLFRDVVIILPVFLNMLFLASPIMYSVPESSLIYKINTYNPLFQIIEYSRSTILGTGNLNSPFIISVFFSITVFFIFWRLFFIAQPRIAERI